MSTEGAPRAYRRLLGSTPFAWLLGAELLSTVGDGFTVLALPIYVYHSTHSAAAAGFTLTARYLPWIAVGPFLGVLADRVERRTVMVGCDLGRCCLTAGLLLSGNLAAVLAISVCLGALSALQRAARTAVIPAVVPAGLYPLAVSTSRVLFVMAMAAGGGAGGIVVSWLGAPAALAADAGTFAASAVIVLLLRGLPAPPSQAGAAAGWSVGWRCVRSSPRLRSCVAGASLIGFMYSAATVLPTLSGSALGSAAATRYGLLLATLAGGSVVGSLLAVRSGFLERYRPGAGPLVFALGYLATALFPGYQVALAAWTLSGAAYGAQLVHLNVVTMQVLPDSARGRGVAVINALGYLGLLSGPGLAGLLVGGVGFRWTLALLAALGASGVLLSRALTTPERAVLTVWNSAAEEVSTVVKLRQPKRPGK